MINRIVRHLDCPPPILTDSRGSFIIEGSKIAYNRSGNIALGTIKKVRKNFWKRDRASIGLESWYSLKFEMEVIGEDDSKSIVKNPNSFVIIN